VTNADGRTDGQNRHQHYHRLHHLLLAQNFILNSRLGSSANPFLHRPFLFYRTDYTDSRIMLNGCTGKCVRLSRPLVSFRMHFKSLHSHFISFYVLFFLTLFSPFSLIFSQSSFCNSVVVFTLSLSSAALCFDPVSDYFYLSHSYSI